MNAEETNYKDILEDDNSEDLEEDQEEQEEDHFDFEAWNEYNHEREVEVDSQRYLDWLYNTRGA